MDGLSGDASRVEAVCLETGCGAPAGSKGWRGFVSEVGGGVVAWWGPIVG